jgi:hypothetical protein
MEPLNAAELEIEIHALLCDDLAEPRRREVLALVARDDSARKLLASAISLQERSRASFGYHQAEAAMEAGLARLKDAMNEKQVGDFGGTGFQPVALQAIAQVGKPVPPRARRPLLRMRRVMALAAAAVLITCVTLTAFTLWENHLTNRRLGELDRNDQQIRYQLAQIDKHTASTVQVSADDLKQYSKIWHETTSAGDSGQPWILIRDGVGRFEYLPAAVTPASKGAGEMVLLRCSVVGPEGNVLEEFNVLLPKDRTVQLSMDQSKQLGDRPLRCRVSSEDRWVGMGLEVGTGAAECVGVQGRVAIGGSPSEIGQFRLDHRNVKVFLQAMPLAGTIG